MRWINIPLIGENAARKKAEQVLRKDFAERGIDFPGFVIVKKPALEEGGSALMTIIVGTENSLESGKLETQGTLGAGLRSTQKIEGF